MQNKIQSRQLGESKLSISELSFGCMSLKNSKEYSAKLIHKAFDEGINFFDTADLYDKGINEEWVGAAVKPFREDVILATKVGNVWRSDGSGWDWKPSKKHILSAVEDSLKRLNTDYIDLYMLHGGTLEDPIDEIIEAFEILKEKGKIREYGISSIRPNVIREYVKRSNISAVMMQYSILDRRPEEECLNLLQNNNINVLSRGSLAKGMLIDKPAKEYLGYDKESVEDVKRMIQSSGNPSGASVQFVLNHPTVASAVVGIRTKQQLNGLLEGYQKPVHQNILKSLSNLLKPNVYEKHR